MVVLVLLDSRLCVETENALEAASERAAGKYHALYEAGCLHRKKNKATIHSIRLIPPSDSKERKIRF